MAIIKSGATSDNLTVDTNKAAYARLRDSAGADVAKADRAAITPGTVQGVPIVGADYKQGRVLRAMSDGSLATNQQVLIMHDPVEGAAVNTNTWTQTTATMTITQAGGIVTLNAGSSVAATVGALHTAQHLCLSTPRRTLLAKSRQRHTAHFNNNVIESGFMTPASSTAAAIGTGAVWRKTGTGDYQPILSIGGSETPGTAITNATWTASIPATDYFILEVQVDEQGATFRALTNGGVLVNEQRLDLSGATPDWTVSHFTPAYRTYNSAGTGTAVQMMVADFAVFLLDVDANKPWNHILSGNGWGSSQSPTAFTQTANYTNNVAPTTRTVNNTTAQEATLGGHVSWNNAGTSFGVSDTLDLVLFGYQIPSPYAFYLTGIRVDTINLGAVSGATQYTVEYSVAVNSNNVSLATAAPNAPRFLPMGFSTLAAAAVVGAQFNNPIERTFSTPHVIQPGRFIHLVGRVVSGTATASQVIRTVCHFEGYFE